jgi:hypothetical protein
MLPFPTGGGSIDFANQGFRPMYSNQWNLAIENQIDTWLFKVNLSATSRFTW